MQSNINTVLEKFDKKFVQHSHPGQFPHFGQRTIIEGTDAEEVKSFISTSIQQLLAQRDEEINTLKGELFEANELIERLQTKSSN